MSDSPFEQVANGVNHPLLDPHKSMRLITTGARVQAWLRHGADMDLIITTIKGVMKFRKDATPVRTWTYFDEPIARAILEKKTMEHFDAEPKTGPAAARVRRGRAAEQVLEEFGGLEVVQRTAAG